MTHYAILDTNAGLLQWLDMAPSAEAAFNLFSADVGGDINCDSLVFFALDVEEAEQVSKWWAAGGKPNETPDCLQPIKPRR